MLARSLTGLIALALIACGGGRRHAGPPTPSADAAAAVAASPCDGLADRVTRLYQAVPRTDGATVGDDVEMVLADCRSAPERLVPCIESAGDAATLERECLIPLDDEGTVEGRMLGGGPR